MALVNTPDHDQTGGTAHDQRRTDGAGGSAVEYKDIPTKADVERIAALRQPGCVSIYLPTGTTPAEADRARIELKNHLASRVRCLKKPGVARPQIQSTRTKGERILEDRNFWRYQSRSLA